MLAAVVAGRERALRGARADAADSTMVLLILIPGPVCVTVAPVWPTDPASENGPWTACTALPLPPIPNARLAIAVFGALGS